MESYNPDPGAIALQQPQRFERVLSQRDLSLTIPVNFVTYPGISLTAACFAHDRYEDQAAAKCFSNLLATGFQRIEVDVYWDKSRRTWALCPVELGGAGSIVSSSTATATASIPSTTQLASDGLAGRDAVVMYARQTSSGGTLSLPSTSTAESTTSDVTTTATLDANPLTTSVGSSGSAPTKISGDETLFQVGPYSCSLGTDLAALVSVASEYTASTEYDLNATAIYMTLNVHAAAEASEPLRSAQKPSADQLPGDDSLLSTIIASNTSLFLYTPADLSTQRGSLNTSRSWFTVAQDRQPDSAFFETDTIGGIVATSDGWPSESYFERTFGKRLLVSFGDIDPQMSAYNFSGDKSYIFRQHYLRAPRVVTNDSDGGVSTGCFFNPNNHSVAAVNSSWAINAIGNSSLLAGSSLENILAQARNLTYCGISPILNGTLNNATADQDVAPYTAFVENTRWSWAMGQPFNASLTPDPSDYRCAALNSTSGFWQVSDCSQSYHGACRVSHQPYTWRISGDQAPYGKVDLACDGDDDDDGNLSFDVPRTALENTYLLSTWQTYQRNQSDYDGGPLLWLNFNDLDVQECWVIGQNSSCPYQHPSSTDTREVVVPVVAGVIVFVIALLTVLLKCAGNRQQSKRRRRRGDDGWDYEGVPS
ncbi:hypothetical protein DOTSEDRAFT_42065 [Lecanosticta acicola]|uniref:Maintenance of telomere capping protein 6 n=1 Tax=Lecanosticta acicola TaxID=111012 RepID=A0AAI9ECE0_9PEZI|nr:hypothetical protein DOTSEDRAFT_42065 [Lecanosticta acicola]